MYIENQQCTSCKNNSICKWVSSKKKIDKKIDEINKDKEFGTPVVIEVTCNKYEKKTEKQDGFRFTNKKL